MKSLAPSSTKQRQQQQQQNNNNNNNYNNNNNNNNNINNKKKNKGDRDIHHHASSIPSPSIDNNNNDDGGGGYDSSYDLNSIQSQSALSLSLSASPSLSVSPSLLKDHAYAWDSAVEALTRYCERSTVIEPPLLTELRLETSAKYSSGAARMLSGKLQGRLLALLSSLSNAKNILELGAFTGYSAICLAQGLDGATATKNNVDNPNSSSGSNDPLKSHDDVNNSVGATTAIKKRRVITCEPDVKSAMIAQKYITKGGFSDQVSRLAQQYCLLRTVASSVCYAVVVVVVVVVVVMDDLIAVCLHLTNL